MSPDGVIVEERGGTTRFTVHVLPRSSGNAIAGTHDGALRVRLSAPPVDGAANEALVKFLAGALGIPRRHIRIAAGATSRRKTIEVVGATRLDVEHLIEST